MSRNIDFAKDSVSKVADDLNLAEDYLCRCQDPQVCMLKVGAAIEDLVVNHIAVRQLLVGSFEHKPTMQKCIELFEKIGSCPKEIIQAIDYIRKRRNRANHEGWNKWHDANECLKQADKILNWYASNGKTVSLFGGRNNENQNLPEN
jgi:hypothetical protein